MSGIKRFNKNHDIQMGYVIEAVVALVLVIVALFVEDNYTVGKALTHYNDYELTEHADGRMTYLFNFAERDREYSDLVFYTTHQNVEVYVDDDIVHVMRKEKDIFGSTPGTGFHFIDLPPGESTVRVELYPVYTQVYNQKLNFYIGDSAEIFRTLLMSSLPAAIASSLSIIIGLSMIAIWIYLAIKGATDTTSLHLAVLSLMVGIWSLNETTVTELVVADRIVSSLVSYFALMLLNVPFILFIADFIKTKHRRVAYELNRFSVVVFVILTVMHFTGYREFRENLIIIQAVLVISFCYGFFGVVLRIIKKDLDRRVYMVIAGMVLLTVSIFTDLTGYYSTIGDADTCGRYAFLLFIIVLLWELNAKADSILEKSRHNSELEEFALTDTMTGMFNRNAYVQHTAELTDLTNLLYVTIDLNNLKQCNDEYGHPAGDDYIITCAKIIEKVFGNLGKCYRLGGDEFCVIIKGAKSVDIDSLLNQMVFLTSVENSGGKRAFKIEMAIGYAMYDSVKDNDLKDTISRADKLMYETKRRQKIAGINS